jgi:hypothetical protein
MKTLTAKEKAEKKVRLWVDVFRIRLVLRIAPNDVGKPVDRQADTA